MLGIQRKNQNKCSVQFDEFLFWWRRHEIHTRCILIFILKRGEEKRELIRIWKIKLMLKSFLFLLKLSEEKSTSSFGLFIPLPQRERKKNYDVNGYFRDALRVTEKKVFQIELSVFFFFSSLSSFSFSVFVSFAHFLKTLGFCLGTSS